jgi:hypothetical protein
MLEDNVKLTEPHELIEFITLYMKGWSGFTLTGDEADEGSNELVRSPRLMNLKGYVSLLRTNA